MLGQGTKHLLEEMKSHARIEQQQAANQIQSQRLLTTQTNTGNSYDVKYYRCEWDINPSVRYLTGKITTYFQAKTVMNTIDFDLMRNMTVDSVVYKNNRLLFTQNNNNTVVIQFTSPISTNQLDSISVYYKGAPIALGSYFIEYHNSTPVVQTLSQPFGSKEWWPCKDALTDKADSIDIVISCPQMYRSSTNGVLVNESVIGTKRIMHYKHRYPITTYLIALACTNYITTSYNWDILGTPIKFENWTYPESATWFNNEAYGVRNALIWFGEKFGTYPFANERYAHTQFSWGGGMEHQTNSFMGSPGHLLAAHELAHQWFGDKTTCNNWKHIWVNEGFASFLHWYYFEKHFQPTYFGIIDEYHNEITSDSAGSVIIPDADTLNTSRIFSWRHTYVKGAYVLHILRGMLGDDVFFNCLKAYTNDPATKYGYSSTSDVKRTFEQASGRNLTSFFNDWVYGEGWPMYQVNWYVNNNGYTNIKVNQRQSHPSVSFFEMPVQLQFKNATRDTIITVDMQQNGQLFSVKLNFTPDTVLVDPKKWILSKNNSQTKSIVANNQTDIVQVYPIPATNTNWNLVIRNPTSTNYAVQLTNAVGQVVYKNNITTSGGDIAKSINNQLLSKGVYHLIVYADREIIFSKSIIK